MLFVPLSTNTNRFASEVVITGGAFAYAIMMYGKVSKGWKLDIVQPATCSLS